jgi:hypothetical protein
MRAIKPTPAGVSVSTLTGIRAPGAADGLPAAFSIGRPSAIACNGNHLYLTGLESAGVNEITLDLAQNRGTARLLTSAPWPRVTYGGDAIFRALAYTDERIDLLNGARTLLASSPANDSAGQSPELISCAGVLLQAHLSMDSTGAELSRWVDVRSTTFGPVRLLDGIRRSGRRAVQRRQLEERGGAADRRRSSRWAHRRSRAS